MKSKLIILIFALVSVIVVFNEDKQEHNLYVNDACGYYLYLPAIFIYHDLSKLSFYPALDSQYNHSLGLQCSLYNISGNILDKYPVGVSLFESPFFCLAHAYCKITNQFKADGFTMPYQLAGIFSNIFWVIAGLFVLTRFLKRYFNDKIIAVTLMCITFGTNLYAYNSFIVGMSHPYSFFLFSCLLSLTDIWYSKQPKWSTSLLIGAILGLIFITRPINIITSVVVLFWMVNNITSLKERAILFGKNSFHILSALVAFFCVTFIQFAYWKYITGHWVFYSYQDEGFNFLHPNILKGIFSYRKGWFVYTPMALIGLSGLYLLWMKNKRMAPSLILFSLVMIYCVFSWQSWWYGGSFGCRALIETYAFLSLPLAALIEYFYSPPGKIKSVICTTLLICIIFLNIFQTYQFSMGLIHWENMTKEYYWRVFMKTNFDRVQNEKYLLKPGSK